MSNSWESVYLTFLQRTLRKVCLANACQIMSNVEEKHHTHTTHTHTRMLSSLGRTGKLTTETGSLASCLTGTGSNMSILLVGLSRVFWSLALLSAVQSAGGRRERRPGSGLPGAPRAQRCQRPRPRSAGGGGGGRRGRGRARGRTRVRRARRGEGSAGARAALRLGPGSARLRSWLPSGSWHQLRAVT